MARLLGSDVLSLLRGGTFAALRFPQHRRLWMSGLVVFLAVNSQTIARGWLARELTGTNAGLGGVLLGFGLAMLVATPFGGVAADRLPKRTVLVVAQLLLVFSSGWIGVAVQFDFVQYWMLIAAGALQAVAFALYGPGRMAFIAELVPEDTMPNAIVLGQMSAEGMRVIGPTTAGILIGAATWGLAAVFIASTVLCTAAVLLTLTLPPGEPRTDRPRRSPWEELGDGLQYVRDHKDISLLVFTSLAVVMAGYPYMAFLPSVADGIFDAGSGGYGLMATTSAIGALAAGFVTAAGSSRRDQWPVVSVAGAVFGIGLVALGLAPVFAVALVVLLVVGGASLMFQTTVNSLLLGRSDFEYHGRIQSLIMLGFSGFGIVALPLGVLADTIGLRTTLVLMGSAALVTTAVYTKRSTRERRIDALLDIG